MSDSQQVGNGRLLASFFKIGAIGFGGGSALIPIVEKEIVTEQKMMDGEEYLKHTVVANITPGALPVKLGATCGGQLGGAGGSLAGAYAVMFPGVALTVAIMTLFSLLGSRIVTYFNYASVGITAFIVFLLLGYIRKTVKGEHLRRNLVLCAISFAITGGKEVREIIGQLTGRHQLGTPLLDISTIDLMILTFFLIILLTSTHSRAVFGAGGVLAGVYALLVGKLSNAYGYNVYSRWVLAAMFLLLVVLFVTGRRQGGKKYQLGLSGPVLVTVGAFLALPIIVTALATLLSEQEGVVGFIAQVCLSTVTSFGGGEAYISVADGIFVQGGYIPSDVFYSRLVPVANALPGPILIKVASGIGYCFGAADGSIASGLLIAAAAACASTGMCSAIAVLVMHLYDNIKHSPFVTSLKAYILPVICGMLLSTSCSMVYESMKVLDGEGVAGVIALPIMIAWIALLFLLTAKRHLNDLFLLLGCAAVSVGGLLLL